ncbi:hypothetical protein NIES2101_32735 [Calothrix sp. HK-06]|nr:hypothetical protein NIES2101_32735 [Calothrix sp. HK-06]
MSLFTITIENGNLEDRRRHLLNVESGEAMFSTAPEPRKKQYQLLAVSLEDTELLKLSRYDFEFLLVSQQSFAFDLVECWINRLGSTFTCEPNGIVKFPEYSIGDLE